MMIIGCDFHTRYQTIAMLDEATGELTERRLDRQTGEADAFYRNLQGPVRVGIAQANELVPMPKQLPQIAFGRCGNPDLREAFREQEIENEPGIALIGLPAARTIYVSLDRADNVIEGAPRLCVLQQRVGSFHYCYPSHSEHNSRSFQLATRTLPRSKAGRMGHRENQGQNRVVVKVGHSPMLGV